MQLLLIEDNLDLATSIVEYLELEGIGCDHATNGIQALALCSQHRFDALILDLNLPKLDGLSVCQRLRQEGNDTPVLMLTARDSLQDKLAGFEAGTDDYLVKPFAIEELLVRVYALAKRRSGQARRLTRGPLCLNLDTRETTLNHAPIRLSPTGLKLLEVLMRAAPNPVSRIELSDKVWGDNPPDSNSLKVHMHKLRKALGQNEHLLETIAGFGFCLKVTHED
ncbi:MULTISPECIES: response regulator transcription factor [Ferrimonas]|uniref:response regulator transcription factor n=1 Tax=Ferrimonas TaxID=44011 RepID=UPI00040F8EDD|nr:MULTISPECIES: response regulator transcription factor [Ferrimonas]USD39436.1 response regulator transcription factor [Ferrimonas sp. SCSIO 43195]